MRLVPAIFMAFLGFTVWTLGDTAIRYLRAYPVEQIIFLPSLYTLFFIACFSSRLGGLRATLQKPKQGLQWLRGVMGAASMLATFYAFMHLEMVDTFAIIFLSPIVAKIFSVVLNKERISTKSWIISIIGFMGVLLVLRPGHSAITAGEIAALCIPATFALSFVLARTIGNENMTPISTIFYMNVLIVAATLVPTFQNFVPMTSMDLSIALFITLTGIIGTYLVTRSYAAAPAAYIAPIQYTQIVWAVIWSALFFKEYPDVWTIAGTGVIVMAGLGLIWQSRHQSLE